MRSLLHPTTESYPITDNYSPPRMVRAALAYARRDIPVFPLKPGDKTPLTPSGFKNATTDPRKITAWWTRWPNANIGIPTGKASGFIVIDVDVYKAGAWSLKDIARELGPLPATTTVSTGRDGLQLYYRLPAGVVLKGIPENVLGPGVCVKAEGGYVVAPPSITAGPYEWLDRSPIDNAPDWLLKELRNDPRRPAKASSTTPAAPIPYSNGETIPEGSRNDAMYRIACGLRARGMDETDILRGMEEINASRCSPPLEPDELEKIAGSACRHAPGSASHEVTHETLVDLDAVERGIWASAWKGIGGKSERDVMIALLKLAREHGTKIPAGVRVSVSVRELALLAGISKRSLLDYKRNGEWKPGVLSRLRLAGWLRRDDLDARRGDAGAFVLVVRRAELHHPNHYVRFKTSGETLRAPYSSPRLRHSAPGIKRLGKPRGEAVDALEIAGGISTVREQAEALHMRPRDYRRRILPDLVAGLVVRVSGETVAFALDWLDAIEHEREIAGEVAAERRDREKYAREREAHRNLSRYKSEQAPTVTDMRENRESAPARRREAIEKAVVRLFRERPEYRTRRVGQITCAIINMGLPDDFPRGVGAGGAPKDHEIAEIMRDNGVDVAA